MKISNNGLGQIYTPDPVEKDHPLNQGRVAWWLATPPLDGGKYFYDLMGLNHGTISYLTNGFKWGGTTRTGGMGQITLNFNPVYNINPIQMPRLEGDFTVGVWCNITANDINNNNDLLALVIYGLAACQIRTNSVSGWGGGGIIYYNQNPTPNLWQRIVYRQMGNTNSFFINGKLNTLTIYARQYGTPTSLICGAYGVYGEEGLEGSVDDMAVWNRSLSDAEVAADYEEGLAGYPKTLRRLSPTSYFLPTYQGSSQLLTIYS